jgi:cytochrome c biogenesis factor
VSRGGKLLSYEEPRLNTYSNSTQAVATPAVYESWKGDVYLSLRSLNPDTVVLGVFWFPFIWLVWAGGLITGMAVLWSRLVRKPVRDDVLVAQAVGDDR